MLDTKLSGVFQCNTHSTQFQIKRGCAIALIYLFLQIISFLYFSSQKSWPKLFLALKVSTRKQELKAFQFYSHYQFFTVKILLSHFNSALEN